MPTGSLIAIIVGIVIALGFGVYLAVKSKDENTK